MNRCVEESGEHWDRGWDVHKKRQLQRLAQLSFSQKLDWLDEAHRIVDRLATQAVNKPECKTESC